MVPSSLGLDETEQQSEGVPIGGHGVGAHLTLIDQPVGEERLEGGGERGHRPAPSIASSRFAAWPSNSGEAERYQ